MSEKILKDKRVLLVEDDPASQRLTTIALKSYGCFVQTIDNGAEVLNDMKKNKYDIILLDIRLPEMDGYEVAEAIRKDYNHDVPIVAVTAYAAKEDVDKCFTVGINDCLTKPFDLNDLKEIIIKWLK